MVHSFQLKLLKEEINRAGKSRRVFKEKFESHDKLSEKQARLLRNGSDSNVLIMDRDEITKFVHGVLSLRPKHTVRDRFNQVHFLADVDKSVLKLCENKGRVRFVGSIV